MVLFSNPLFISVKEQQYRRRFFGFVLQKLLFCRRLCGILPCFNREYFYTIFRFQRFLNYCLNPY